MSRTRRTHLAAFSLGGLVLLQACTGGRSTTQTGEQAPVSALAQWLQAHQDLELRQLSFSSSDQLAPAGIPGTQDLLYQSNGDGNWELYRVSIESGNLTRVTDTPENEEDPSVSPDGRRILCTLAPATAMQAPPRDILIMSLDGKERRKLAQHGADDWFPRFSADGEGVFFVSDRVDERLDIDDDQRKSAVFFYNLRTDELQQLTAGEDESAPLPLADGSLLYRAGDGALHRLDPQSSTDELVLGAERGVFGRPVSVDNHWILPGQQGEFTSVLFAASADFQELDTYVRAVSTEQRTPAFHQTELQSYLLWSEFHEGQWDLYYQLLP